MALKPFLLTAAAVVAFSASSALLVSFSDVSAAPPPPVGAHRHFIMVDEQKVYVGPNFCEVAATEQGFAAFHAKVHVTDPGLVESNGAGGIDVDFEFCGEE